MWSPRPSELLASLLLATQALATTARADLVTLEVDAYQSPNYTNSQGTASFHSDGTTHLANPTTTITLTANIPSMLGLDYSVGDNFQSPPSNNDPTTTFFGTATSLVTIDGVTESISDAYSFVVPPPSSTTFPFVLTTPTYTGGASVVFDLGQEVLTVTPIASVAFREASFVLNAVPEPSTLALCGVAGLLGLAVSRARRMLAPPTR